MDAFTAPKRSKVDQCRDNAKSKSAAKRKAFLEALALMVKEHKPLVKAQVCKRADVTPPFLRKHPDLLQALENAQRKRLTSKEVVEAATSADRGKDRVIEALKRQLDAKQAVINAKEVALREKDRTISVLLGKLAANSPLSDSELYKQLAAQTQRAERSEARVKDLESRLLAKRVVKFRDQIRRLEKKRRGTPLFQSVTP
jgi:hypothetical protein